MENQSNELAFIRKHLVWGWAVYCADNGEGVDGMWDTEAEAFEVRQKNYEGEVDDVESVEVFPLAFFRDVDQEIARGIRLTPEEIAMLGACPKDGAK
jgi:hypothetical protein